MFSKEGFCKIHHIGNGPVRRIRPPAGKLKAVAGAFTFIDSAFA